ncbi:MAG: ABC transporter ATP-binding protein [Spirochaetaceae bacterium]|jgi:simple sugar transport system ATP-binding protein|nr:ABC transporter ATP-binding protein [Spirochaetaceae bacterium]
MAEDDYILQMKHITKSFGSLIANEDVSINVRRGTVLALIGENGAGKSTLMNILTNIHKADYGKILLNGREVQFKDPLDAACHGIGMVYQEFMLFRDLTVLENIIMGFEKKRGKFFIDKKKSRRVVEDICTRYHFNIPLDEKINELAVSLLQQVEIVKVLYKGAELLVLDEPTSVLTPQGIEGLFDAIRFLTGQGKTVIFITHKLKEVFAIADDIAVMRDGKVVGTTPAREINEQGLAGMMVGREVMLQAQKRKAVPGELVLGVRKLRVKDGNGIMRVRGIDLDVHAGEIVGIAGVAGSGQQQLIEAIFGIREPEPGSGISLCGEDLVSKSARDRRTMGVGYVPQDRLGAGVSAQSSIWENAIMGYHITGGLRNRVFLDRRRIGDFTWKIVKDYDVKTPNIENRVKNLSGGNIQKLVVGREFIQKNKLLIIEDPTRGIDVGAIEFIWEQIIELAAGGVAVLLVSHELNEVMQLSDRIMVIYNGTLFNGGRHGELSDKELGLLMTGGVLHAD